MFELKKSSLKKNKGKKHPRADSLEKGTQYSNTPRTPLSHGCPGTHWQTSGLRAGVEGYGSASGAGRGAEED